LTTLFTSVKTVADTLPYLQSLLNRGITPLFCGSLRPTDQSHPRFAVEHCGCDIFDYLILSTPQLPPSPSFVTRTWTTWHWDSCQRRTGHWTTERGIGEERLARERTGGVDCRVDSTDRPWSGGPDAARKAREGKASGLPIWRSTNLSRGATTVLRVARIINTARHHQRHAKPPSPTSSVDHHLRDEARR